MRIADSLRTNAGTDEGLAERGTHASVSHIADVPSEKPLFCKVNYIGHTLLAINFFTFF